MYDLGLHPFLHKTNMTALKCEFVDHLVSIISYWALQYAANHIAEKNPWIPVDKGNVVVALDALWP